MNCGKHCTYKDYDSLVTNTERYLKCLNNGDPEVLTTKLNIYLEFIADFDIIVSEKMRLKIQHADGDLNKVKQVVRFEVEELIHNVLVDIREHN